MIPLYVFIVGCPEDQFEQGNLVHELTMKVPAISVGNLQYGNLLNKLKELEGSSHSCLFIIMSKYLKLDTYLNQVLNKVTEQKQRIVFYPLSISNNYQSASSWRELVKMIEYARDKTVKRSPKVIVYLLKSQNKVFKDNMSDLYSRFINNQNVRFYNINKIQQLANQRIKTSKDCSIIIIVSQSDINQLSEQHRFFSAQQFNILVYNPERKGDTQAFNTASRLEDVQNYITMNINNARSNILSNTSSKYSSYSINSASSKSSVNSGRFSSQIQSFRDKGVNKQKQSLQLLIFDNQNSVFKRMYQKLSLNIPTTIVSTLPSSFSTKKLMLILAPIQQKSKVTRAHSKMICIFFSEGQQYNKDEGNSNIFITHLPSQIQQFIKLKGSSIKQVGHQRPTKSVKFADQIDIQGSSQSNISSVNSNIIKNLNKNKKKKPIQNIHEIMSQYDIGDIGIIKNTYQVYKNQVLQSFPKTEPNIQYSTTNLSMLPVSVSMPDLNINKILIPPPIFQPSSSKPARQLKIQKTINIHTNLRPVSSGSITSIFNTKGSKLQNSTTSLSHTPTLIKTPDMTNRYNRPQTQYKNIKTQSLSNQKKVFSKLQNNITKPIDYSSYKKQMKSDKNDNNRLKQLSLKSPLKLSIPQKSQQANNCSIIDSIYPLTDKKDQLQISYKQKHKGKNKGNIFLVPQQKQALVEELKRVLTLNDDLVSFRNQKSLEEVHYENYKLALMFQQDNKKNIPELCMYIPNLYVLNVIDQTNISNNPKQIIIKNINEIPYILNKISQPKPTYFSFIPKSQPISKSPYFSFFPTHFQSTQSSQKIPIFYPSMLSSKLPMASKLFNQLIPLSYSNQFSLLSQLKNYPNQTIIIIIQPSLFHLIPKIPETNSYIFSLNSQCSGVKTVKNIQQLMSQIEFITRL